MSVKYSVGFGGKQIYRNERFNKGTISTNDPLSEGSFRRLINFKPSNQGKSSENRDPFLTVPLYDLNNNEIVLSENAFVFSFNNDTEHAFILDLNQERKIKSSSEIFSSTILKTVGINDDYYVIDGDTIYVDGIKYRLGLIDTPELEDTTYDPIYNSSLSTMGQEAKNFTKDTLLGKEFYLLQFEFQTETKDEYGRTIVFIAYREEDEIKLLNIELLRKGLATFYGTNSFKETNLIFEFPNQVKILEETFDFFSTLSAAYYNDDLLDYEADIAYGPTYTDNEVTLKLDNEKTYYTKPKIYKIKKETDLKQLEDGTIIKRVIKILDVNELLVKLDLFLSTEKSLRYELISDDFSIINGKYSDQYLNLYIQIYDKFDIEIYRGLMEITHVLADYDQGLEETFKFKTYNNPDAHIEIQDIVNSKPNMLDSKTIIPETLIGKKSNVKGETSMSVNAVLLNVNLNEYLELPSKTDDIQITKIFNTNRSIFADLKKYNLTPFFKAPILKTKKSNYMFRWDFVNLAKINLDDEEEIENAKPFFRSAWTRLVSSPSDLTDNISTNLDRNKSISIKLKNLKKADEFYFIKSAHEKQVISDVLEEVNINELYDDPGSTETRKTLQELQVIFNDFIENNSLDDIKSVLSSGDTDDQTTFEINGYDFQIEKIYDEEQITSILNINSESSNIAYDIYYKQTRKNLTKAERIKLFELDDDEEEKRISFIFAPIEVVFSFEDYTKRIVSYAWETKGIVIETSIYRKQVIPYNINFEDLYNMTKKETNPLDLDFDDFFKSGILGTFYLYNYESEDKLTEPDVFYDNIAYKKTSATYLFRSGITNNYNKNDFIDEKLDEESRAINYCKYLTSFEDRILTYGNSTYKNTIFMSEEGSPYYFSLSNIFEFDYEVVHVQPFKTIMLVFTINDVWVIFKRVEINEFNETIISWFTKKVLYNISTEAKNKVTIQNITRYITLMSNNILYLIKPSTFISDDTEFSLTELSKNIDMIVKDPLDAINERLKYFGINSLAEEYEISLNATDNYIKIYYTTIVEDQSYTLILTYDILNGRWTEEDTITFGKVHQLYLLDSTTKYEMLTEKDNQLFITYQTDKYKNLMLDEYSQSCYDRNPNLNRAIEYYIDTGYIKLNEHLEKRFKKLLLSLKNQNSKQILFNYNFTVDDKQFHNNFEPDYTVNNENEIVEILNMKNNEISNNNIIFKIKELLEVKNNQVTISDIGTLDEFILDFSNLEIGDIMTIRQSLLGKGRLPRLKMNFTASDKFYILSFGIMFSEHGGR